MSAPWNELHTLLIYVIFGYSLLFPLLLLGLQLFRVYAPLQRLRLYLLVFLTPPVAFILYHSVLTKRCQAGLPPSGAQGLFNLACAVAESLLGALWPLLAVLLLLGLLKGAAAALMVRRLQRESDHSAAGEDRRIQGILQKYCPSLGIKPPRVIFSRRAGLTAFTAGFFKPVVVVSLNIAAALDECELEALLGHELIHIRHRDTFKSWLLHLVRDVTFYNPLNTFAVKALPGGKELLCDQEAARLVRQSPRMFAAALLKVWRTGLEQRSPGFGVVSAFKGSGGGMERRIRELIRYMHQGVKGSNLITVLLGAVLFSAALLFLGLLC